MPCEWRRRRSRKLVRAWAAGLPGLCRRSARLELLGWGIRRYQRSAESHRSLKSCGRIPAGFSAKISLSVANVSPLDGVIMPLRFATGRMTRHRLGNSWCAAATAVKTSTRSGSPGANGVEMSPHGSMERLLRQTGVSAGLLSNGIVLQQDRFWTPEPVPG